MSARSAMPCLRFVSSNIGVAGSRQPNFEAKPFKNLFVRPALQHSVAKISIMDPQKITAHPIDRFHRAKILVIIFVQLSAGMQPNLVQHPREIHHATRHFFRALWIGRHMRELNRDKAARKSAPKHPPIIRADEDLLKRGEDRVVEPRIDFDRAHLGCFQGLACREINI
jgi:hypothetical protein